MSAEWINFVVKLKQALNKLTGRGLSAPADHNHLGLFFMFFLGSLTKKNAAKPSKQGAPDDQTFNSWFQLTLTKWQEPFFQNMVTSS